MARRSKAKARRRPARASSNPRAVAKPEREIEKAAQLLREFREIEPGQVSKVQLKIPRAAMVVGELECVGYRTDHDGRAERYLHQFKKGSRPALLASADGRVLLILGGKFTFTGRGIVDRG